MKPNYTAVALALLLGAGIAQGAELIIDNGSPQFTTLGDWPLSTAVAGYEGKHYQTHINNAPPPGSLVVDNQDPGFSVTGDWPVSAAVGGYLGSNYQTHASNGPKPGSLVVDNPSGIPVGDWPNSTSVAGAQGGSYQTHTAGTGQSSFTWPLAGSGQYRVYTRWTAYGNRATNAQYQVRHAAGTSTVTVDQRQNGGQWMLLGTYDLDAGSQVVLTDQANGYVIADAVMAEPVAATANTATWQLPVTETKAYQVYARWTAHPNRATNAKYRVTHSNGNIDIPVSQQQQSGQWVLLGNFTLSPGKASVSLTDEADGYVIADAVMANPQDGLGANAAIWTPSLSQGGRYDIYAKWTAYPNRATNAQYRIQHQSGEAVVEVNQQQNGGQWNLLGRYDLVPGQARISLTDQANGYVIADAIRLVEAAPEGGVVYYIDADHLNTPRVVTDAQGKVVWRNLPLGEPFGNTPPEDDPDGDDKHFAMNLRFPGQYFDRETNLNYNYFRDYDPATGRYVQSDPIGLQGGINTYSYVRGDPLGKVDPTGLLDDYVNRAAGLQPDKPRTSSCGTACRECKMKWLAENYTETGAHAMQEFSAFSYIDPARMGTTIPLTAAGLATKKGFLNAVRAAATWTEGSAAAGAAVGSVTATGLVGFFGVFMPAFATTAEILASRACGCGYLE